MALMREKTLKTRSLYHRRALDFPRESVRQAAAHPPDPGALGEGAELKGNSLSDHAMASIDVACGASDRVAVDGQESRNGVRALRHNAKGS